MVRITANVAVRALLDPIKEKAEILDDRGGLVGYFLPATSEEAQIRNKIITECDPAEIARRKASKLPGRTTSEVLEYLDSMSER